MKPLIRYFILGIVFFLLPSPIYAQGEGQQKPKQEKKEVPEETDREIERREEAERLAEEREEARVRRREAEERRRRAEEMFPESTYYEERDLKEAREHYYRKIRLDSFLNDVDKFQRVAVAVRACAFAPLSEAWAVKDLEKHSKEFEKMTERLRKFIDYGIDPPTVEVPPLPDESLESRLRRLVRMTNRLVPRIIKLTTADILDLKLQRRVRQDLAMMKVLSRALRN